MGGGSRSGKSRYALEYAERCGDPRWFIATAEARDTEMESRILTHKMDRGPSYHTIEEPRDLADALDRVDSAARAIVVDCLTLWTSNLMFAERDVVKETAGVIEAAGRHHGAVIFVTNEVGCGIVPENELARRFRDLAGWVNQEIAKASAEIYWTVFGFPMRVK